MKKNKNQLSLIYLNRKVVLKFSEKFEDDSLNYLLDSQIEDGNKIGNVMKGPNESFVFIDSESNRYFAHYTDFPEIKTTNELKKVKNGQLVSFEEGHNSKGICAKNVKIISS